MKKAVKAIWKGIKIIIRSMASSLLRMKVSMKLNMICESMTAKIGVTIQKINSIRNQSKLVY